MAVKRPGGGGAVRAGSWLRPHAAKEILRRARRVRQFTDEDIAIKRNHRIEHLVDVVGERRMHDPSVRSHRHAIDSAKDQSLPAHEIWWSRFFKTSTMANATCATSPTDQMLPVGTRNCARAATANHAQKTVPLMPNRLPSFQSFANRPHETSAGSANWKRQTYAKRLTSIREFDGSYGRRAPATIPENLTAIAP